MAEESGVLSVVAVGPGSEEHGLYVKSPVASLCLVCSSVRKRVRVTMSVLIFSELIEAASPVEPFAAMPVSLKFDGLLVQLSESGSCQRVVCLGKGTSGQVQQDRWQIKAFECRWWGLR